MKCEIKLITAQLKCFVSGILGFAENKGRVNKTSASLWRSGKCVQSFDFLPIYTTTQLHWVIY